MGHSRHFISSLVDDRQALLQTILDHSPVGVSVFDAHLQLVLVNRRLMDWLDLPPHLFAAGHTSLEALTLFNAERGEYGPGDPKALTEQRMDLARQGIAHRFRRQRPDGRVVEITGEPLPGGGFLTIYTDVTEAHRVEMALREQGVHLQSVLDHLPQGISVFDQHLRLKSWNAQFRALLELPEAAVYPNVPFEDLIRVPAQKGEYGPGDPDELVAQRCAVARQFQPHRMERTRPNGSTHLVDGCPMTLDGQVVGFVTSYTDITAQRGREASLAEQTTLLQTLVDNMPGGVTVFDKDLQLVLYNQQAMDLLGFGPEVLAGRTDLAELVRWNAARGDYGDIDVEALVSAAVAHAQQPRHHRAERIRANGVVIEMRIAPMPGGGFVTIYADVTEQKTVERELRRQAEVFQTLVNNIPGGVTLFGAQWELLAHNQEFARLLEFPEHLFERQPTLERFVRFNVLRGEYGVGDVEAQVRDFMVRAQRREPHLFTRTRPNGTMLEVRGMPLADGGFVTIYTDVTERHRAAEAIERLAHRDTLTGLANRYTLEARLDQLVADARRHTRRLAVMFLDMDNFKAINDTQGHAVGDQFLAVTAQRLQATVRDNDIVARLGGDEFVVVLADVEGALAVTQVAALINHALQQAVLVGDTVLYSSASIGICFYPEDGQDRGALMQSADMAMYHAKKAGKAGFHLFDPAMLVEANARLGRELALREAVAQQALELHYQPVMDATGQRPVAVEALMRWRLPSGVLVPPLEFIPLAEEMRLIDEMGHWALTEACQTLVQWRTQGLTGLGMAVNVSAVQLRNPGFVQQVQQVLRDTGLPGEGLTLEITESVAMERPEATAVQLEALRRLGVGLAIDDFGTGYSSLAYLKRLPLSSLKVDRTFVQDLQTDRNDAAICAATIALAHNLGLQTVAEGVETAAQHQYLADLGCDRLQGYWFSRPLPKDQALAWLLERSGQGA